MEIKPYEFSRCETCNAELDGVKMDAPLYCISCIGDMDRLGMTPRRYRKHLTKMQSSAQACLL